MFRIPTLAEIFGLFCKSRTVAGATKAISDTVKRLEDVVTHHNARANRKLILAADHRQEAACLSSEAADHHDEANKAAVVAKNLSALLS